MKEQLWNTLLQLKQTIRISNKEIHYCYLQFGQKNQVLLNAKLKEEEDCKIIKIVFKPGVVDGDEIAVFHLKNNFASQILSKGKLTEEELSQI